MTPNARACSDSNLRSSAVDALFRDAQSGDRQALAALVVQLSPVMARTIRSTLAASRHWKRGAAADDVSDVLHDLMLGILERGPNWLSGLNPALGHSIEGAFRLRARRAARSFLRSGRRSAWAETASDNLELACAQTSAQTEAALLARDDLRHWWSMHHTTQAGKILRALHVDGLSVEEVCATWSLTANAIYCIARRARAHAKPLELTEGRR